MNEQLLKTTGTDALSYRKKTQKTRPDGIGCLTAFLVYVVCQCYSVFAG